MELIPVVIGPVIGLAALAWGIWVWLLSGPRVVVRTVTFRPMVGNPSKWTLEVRIRNKGRAATTLDEVGCSFSSSETLPYWAPPSVTVLGTFPPYSYLTPPSDPTSPALPYRLESQSGVTFKYQLNILHRAPRIIGQCYVGLGSGKTIREDIWINNPNSLTQWLQRKRVISGSLVQWLYEKGVI
jgi:hypothetical protein